MRTARTLGITLLAIWLIATGVLQFIHLAIPGLGAILAVLAIVAGVLLLIGR